MKEIKGSIIEEVYLHAYETVSVVRDEFVRYLDFYNSRRPHSLREGNMPDAFYYRHLPVLEQAV